MTVVILGLLFAGGVALIGLGVWSELRAPASTNPVPETPASIPATLSLAGRVQAVIHQHPAPLYGLIETGIWLFVLLTLIDHLLNPDGMSAWVAWLLTIGPHEIGHVICMPFGWTLHVLGGSIWQIIWWLLLAIYVLLVHRRISGALLFLAITGHSFLNLAPYIADARARELPLLFGMDSSHHDWWNLLREYDLLPYDHALATACTVTGVITVLLAVTAGLLTTWLIPRRQIDPMSRQVSTGPENP